MILPLNNTAVQITVTFGHTVFLLLHCTASRWWILQNCADGYNGTLAACQIRMGSLKFLSWEGAAPGAHKIFTCCCAQVDLEFARIMAVSTRAKENAAHTSAAALALK